MRHQVSAPQAGSMPTATSTLHQDSTPDFSSARLRTSSGVVPDLFHFRVASSALRKFFTLALLILSLGNAWAQTNYVFINGTSNYLYNNNGTPSVTTSFSPSCVWIASGALAGSNTNLKNIKSYTDQSRYLQGTTSSAPSLTTSESNTWRRQNDPQYLTHRQSSNYYLQYSGENLSFSKNAAEGNRFASKTVSITSHNNDNMTISIAPMNNSSQLSVGGNVNFQAALDGGYGISYTTYTFNSTTHNWYGNQDNGTSTPSSDILYYDLNRCSYTWTLEGNGADYATITPYNAYSANVAYNTAAPSNTTVTVKLVLTDAAAGFSRTVTYNLTLLGSSLQGFYRIQNAGGTSYYLDVSTSNYNNDSNTPYIRGNNTDNAPVWYLEPVGDDYRIIHVASCKYVVYHGSNGAAAGNLFHLDSMNTPNDQTLFTLTSTNSGYNIKPKGYGRSFNEYGGHGNNIGLYSATNSNSYWNFIVQPYSIPAPNITYDNTTNKVTISNGVNDQEIRYTLNGTDPTASSTLYSSPFTQTTACTVKAAAYKCVMHSAVTEFVLTKVATPVISQNGNNLEITCATTGATIYYKTTSGGSYSEYTSPIPTTGLSQIWAYAKKDNCINSDAGYLAFDPSAISITTTSPLTVYVGQQSTINYTLTPDPCYNNVVFSSDHTNIATVATPASSGQTTVTGIAVGQATITATAKKSNGESITPSATITVNVRNKVATPTITFSPNTDPATATATIECTTQGVNIYYTTDGTEPTSTDGTLYPTATGITSVANGATVKAIAYKTGDASSLYDPSDVASATYNQQKLPTPTIQIVGDRVWFLCDVADVTFRYTTTGTDPTATTGTTNTGAEITGITAGATIKVIATKSGWAPSDVVSKVKQVAHIVYLDFSNGNNSNSGADASHAVKDWATAYSKLGYGPNALYLKGKWKARELTAASTYEHNNIKNVTDFSNTVENNVIYLVGDVSSSNIQELLGKGGTVTSEVNHVKPILDAGYMKPATISGLYGSSRKNANPSTSCSSSTGYSRINFPDDKDLVLNEDTRFEYVEFYGASESTTHETQILLAYYDLEMGKGITVQRMLSTRDFNTYHHGYDKTQTNTAHILFYGGLTNDARFTGDTYKKELDFDNFLPHPEGYKITIRSGYFSTISPGGKQWNDNINGAMGSPKTPVKCTILIDVDHAWNDAHNSGVLRNGTAPDCDVAVIMAGTHQGNMYGNVDIIVKSGRIDRVVNGTLGARQNCAGNNYPVDSYFGRASILVDPREPSSAETAYANKNAMVTIRELYGGGLGRFKADNTSTSQSATYFYGQSSVTINGGTFKTAIYASGAGGVNGVGDDDHHTNDTKLPYWSSSAKTSVTYGTYANFKACTDANKQKLYVMLRNSNKEIYDSVDIAKTSTKIEIHGGVFGSQAAPIEGIFGGGFGWVDSTLINYTNSKIQTPKDNNANKRPNAQAGSIFAAAGDLASSVLIDGDAVIWGNVYGAGRGSAIYYNSGNSTITPSNYAALGLISGNVKLTIGGSAIVHGNVYGAGKGVNGFGNMARLYGNSTITIGESATITGGVYGGGRDGSMDGNVNLTITGSATIGASNATANVHGGGLGAQTRVLGDVNVKIGDQATDDFVIYGDVYGGSGLGKTNGDSSRTSGKNTNVTLNAGTINGSLYGGGLGDANNAADVYGPVAVKVYGGTVNTVAGHDGSGAVYGCNNVNGAPQNTVTVDIYGTDPAIDAEHYALDAVYGGGNAADYTYGNGYPKVTVHNCDNSIEYVYGGGNAAAVTGTDVTIYGGTLGNVFGGGNGFGTGNPGADVGTGGTTTKIYGGTIGNVFGGSNAKGEIDGAISLTIKDLGESGGDACGMQLAHVYGGGNKAASGPGTITVECFDGRIEEIYGGANDADINGNITLNIKGGNFGKIFGGNNTGHAVKGDITVNVTKALSCSLNVDYVYGGGNKAAVGVTGNTRKVSVTVDGAKVNHEVFGGGLGNSAVTNGSTSVLIKGSTDVEGSVYGGGSAAPVTGNTSVQIGSNE